MINITYILNLISFISLTVTLIVVAVFMIACPDQLETPADVFGTCSFLLICTMILSEISFSDDEEKQRKNK